MDVACSSRLMNPAMRDSAFRYCHWMVVFCSAPLWAADPLFERQVLAKNMLKVLGKPDDIAWGAVWLASDEARYVTGSDIVIDAGATAW